MGARSLSPVTSLDDPTSPDERAVGGKAANVARMRRAGMQVPAGFCVTVAAYEQFLGAADLAQMIRRELGIVFVGKPEFNRERTFGGRAARAADR